MTPKLLVAVCFTCWSVLGTLLLTSTQTLEPDHTNLDYSRPETLLLLICMTVAISMYAFAHFYQIIITQQLQIRVTGIKSCSIYFIQVQCKLLNVLLSYGHDIKFDAYINTQTDVAYLILIK